MRYGRLAGLAGLLMVAGTLSGCNNSLKAERDQLFNENVELRDRVAQAKSALQAAEDDRNELAQANAEYRMENDRLQRLAQQPQAPQQPRTGFEGISGVTGDMRPGEVAAVVEGDVLFDSGQITLKSDAKRSLDQVASVLNSTYSGKTIRIEGHTDTDPIRKSPWKTNDRLSAERAMAVKQYLETRGVEGSRMYIAGFGSNRAKSTKKDSRRVEIVVLLQ